ncbi:MAG: HD domain-containing protein [Lachnospiraceae bacterium]|jgi:putative hydrolase of HD superfamily
MNKRLEQQMKFILEVDKLKCIGRQTYLSHGKRKENDAEHSWHLALMAALLSEHANEEVDVLRVMIMVLIHDVVEIDAGDTYAYDEVGKSTQRERELRAAERIFGLLPEDQAKKMMDLWEEFEARKTIESRFAHALDNMQPVTLNDASGGKSWMEHEVKKSQVMERQSRNAEASLAISEFVQQIIKKNVESGKIRDE